MVRAYVATRARCESPRVSTDMLGFATKGQACKWFGQTTIMQHQVQSCRVMAAPAMLPGHYTHPPNPQQRAEERGPPWLAAGSKEH